MRRPWRALARALLPLARCPASEFRVARRLFSVRRVVHSRSRRASRLSAQPPTMAATPFAAELIATANAIATAGKGILAADESAGTIGKRFETIGAGAAGGCSRTACRAASARPPRHRCAAAAPPFSAGVENNEENRRFYRQMLFETAGLNQYISGCIVFEETLFHKSDDGTPCVFSLPRMKQWRAPEGVWRAVPLVLLLLLRLSFRHLRAQAGRDPAQGGHHRRHQGRQGHGGPRGHRRRGRRAGPRRPGQALPEVLRGGRALCQVVRAGAAARRAVFGAVRAPPSVLPPPTSLSLSLSRSPPSFRLAGARSSTSSRLAARRTWPSSRTCTAWRGTRPFASRTGWCPLWSPRC